SQRGQRRDHGGDLGARPAGGAYHRHPAGPHPNDRTAARARPPRRPHRHHGRARRHADPVRGGRAGEAGLAPFTAWFAKGGIMILAALALIAQAAAPAPCPANEPCEVPFALSATAAATRLGNRPDIWWLDGDILTVVARREGEATLCCAIQQRLHPIGPGLQAVSMRVPDVTSAILDILVIPPVGAPNLDPVWRGSRAPPAPDRSDIAEVSTVNHTIDSTILHQPRDIFVYVPPGLAAGQRVPVIYVADGLLDNFTRIADAAIRKGRAAPVILVGIVPGTGPAVCPEHWCTARNREYLVDVPDPAIGRFDVQDRFVTEEVIPFVEGHYPVLPGRNARAIMGQSAGGAWALVMAA